MGQSTCLNVQEQKRSARAFEKLAGKIEPGMMAKHFMRPEDNVIRVTDFPEREQAYRGPDPSNMDFKAMATYDCMQTGTVVLSHSCTRALLLGC